MRSYLSALDHYNTRPNPPRSKKWKGLPDNARPLGRTGDTHKGIHKTEDGVIYYRLYDTNIATFYPPNADGDYRVVCRYYNSVTTRTFINDNSLTYGYLITTEDTYVSVPYVPSRMNGASLLFNADGKLIVSESSHPDIYTRVANMEDKAKRRALMADLETLVLLCSYRLDNYKAEATVEEHYGMAFARKRWQPTTIDDFERVVSQMRFDSNRNGTPFNFADPDFVQVTLELGQGVVDVLASSRAVADGYESHRPNREISAKAVASITLEDFKRSLYNRLLKVFKLDVGSERKPWGQFMPKLPRKAFF